MLLVFHPYIRKGDDRFHLLTQTELFLLALMGQIIRSNQIVFSQDAVMDALLSVCLIVIVLFLIVSFLIIAGRNIHKIIQHGRAKRAQKKVRDEQAAKRKENEPPTPEASTTYTVSKPAPLVL